MGRYSQTLLKQAGQLSFNNPVGGDIDLSQNGIQRYGGATNYGKLNYPGIMNLDLLPTFGISENPNDAENQAGVAILQNIQDKLSNVIDKVDSADVCFYLRLCDSAICLHAWLVRLRGTLRDYNQRNIYEPAAEIRQMHVDFEDVRKHASDLTFFINDVADRMQVLQAPKEFGIFERHASMVGNIYKDEKIVKSQHYIYNYKYYLKFDVANNKLVTVDFAPSTPMTYDVIVSKVNEVLNSILPDYTMNTVAGLFKKVYSSFWTVNQIEMTHKQVPIYDEDVVKEIHNANFLSYDSVDSLDVTQVANGNYDTNVRFSPTFTTKNPAIALKRIIDLPVDDPKAEEVIAASRLMFSIKNWSWNSSTKTGTFKIADCGTEIVLQASIAVYNADQSELKIIPFTQFPQINIAPLTGVGIVTGYSGVDMETSVDNYLAQALVTQFKWTPIRFGVDVAIDGTINGYTGTVGEIDNYTVLDDNVIGKLSIAWIYDQLNIEKTTA